jgi:NAD+ diphosphatase
MLGASLPSPRFRPTAAPLEAAQDATVFAFRGNDLLVRLPSEGAAHALPSKRDLDTAGLIPVRTQPLGWLDDRPCFAAELPEETPLPEGLACLSLRKLHGRMDDVLFDVAGMAYQVQDWDRTHQFCSTCGERVLPAEGERAKRCGRCGVQYFPRITPATIVLVEDGDQILMTRGPRFPKGMYGLVAGFVEPGETLEACVAREVQEETGIEIQDIVYFGSQPWPFPHQIMLGFFARRAGGELRVNLDELEEAAFFRRDALPALPPPLSIARKLIDTWLSRSR